MKRYFMVNDNDMPTINDDCGNWHFIDLSSHGPNGSQWNLVCLIDNHIKPNDNWLPFPAIYDSKTTLAMSPILQDKLSDIGLTGDETAIEAVVKLGEINPIMGF